MNKTKKTKDIDDTDKSEDIQIYAMLIATLIMIISAVDAFYDFELKMTETPNLVSSIIGGLIVSIIGCIAVWKTQRNTIAYTLTLIVLALALQCDGIWSTMLDSAINMSDSLK